MPLQNKIKDWQDLSATAAELVRRDAAGDLKDGQADVAKDWADLATAAAELIRHKDEFIATIAHEFRNPLHVLDGAVQSMEYLKIDDADFINLKEMIVRQVKHLTTIVDDLLELTRFNEGKIRYRMRVMKFSDAVKEGIEMGKVHTDAKKQTIKVSGESDVKVNGDLTRLVQVIVNLVVNASKYTPEGGKISVATTQDNDRLVFTVTDDGVGIPLELLEQIFDQFAQVEATIERSRGGLGIGLNISRRIITEHQGTILASSEGTEKGSTFTINLPISTGEEPLPDVYTILIVDDVKDSADSLASVLRNKGHIVHTAYDAQTAISAVVGINPQYVLMDIGMPGMDGYDAAKEIRKLVPSAILVAITGFGDNRLAKAAGFDYLLTKPVMVEQLGMVFTKNERPTS